MICHTPQELSACAHQVATVIGATDLVLFYGPLGAGKTFFVKALCQAWGISPEQVSSPTFTLLHYYEGRYNVAHFDLYRLSDTEEFFLIGGDEVLGQQICLIEWPQLIEEELPTEYIRIDIEILPDSGRRVEICRMPEGILL